MIPKCSVWLLFFAVIFKIASSDVSHSDGMRVLDTRREANVKRTHGGAIKAPVPPSLSPETRIQPLGSRWKLRPEAEPTGINPLSDNAGNKPDSGIKTPPEKRPAVHEVRVPTASDEKPLRKPFISSDPSSTTEKVFVEDMSTMEKEALLIVKVKTSHVSQPSVGKEEPEGASQKLSQAMGLMKSKGTKRVSTPIPASVTSPEVGGNKTAEEGATPAYDDLVYLSLIDVPEREETTTCGPGERWHNNRCREAIG